MKTLRTSMIAAAGALAGLAIFTLTSFQGVPGPARAAGNPWPPRPSFIVNWVTYNEIGPAGVDIPAGGDLVLMDVPTETWLVITELTGVHSGLQFFERQGGTDTLKFRGALAGGSALGSVFRPGSQVVVQNLTSSSTTLEYYSRFTGYYTR